MSARRTLALVACLAAPFAAPPALAETKAAIFAGGCFWCVEADFDKVPGVTSTVSGYIGGSSDNPTYKNHSSTGHREAVRIEYESDTVSYDQLLDIFFRSVDPTDAGGQFCDRGHSYTTAVYADGEAELEKARAAKAEAQAELGTEVVTEIVPAPTFWPAEDYHQDYYLKNPVRYKYYRTGCRRDARIEAVWGDSAHQGIPSQ